MFCCEDLRLEPKSVALLMLTFALVLVVGLAPLLVVSVLVAIKLDGAQIPLQLVFIPFWVIDGLYLLVPLLACVIGLGSLVVRCRRLDLSGHDVRQLVTGFFISYIVFVPLTMFEILLVLRENDVSNYKFSTVFIPLFIWEALFVVFGFILGAFDCG